MLAQKLTDNLRSKFVIRIAMLFAFGICGSMSGQLSAQFADTFLNNNGVVGGVSIDAEGVLNTKAVRLDEDIRQQLQQGLESADSDINKPGLRMVSLKALEQAMMECKNSGKPFPSSIKFMAGLQRIEYVMVSKENDDVILAGPAEGLKTDANGNVVGATSGMPAIRLEDFLVAMRYVDQARQGYGITVSIDPTEEGIQNVRKLMRNYTVGSFNNNSAKALEDACGPQNITLTGVPKDSRFSQVLVSADYKMKRLAMGLDPAPEFLPNILAMAKRNNSRFNNMSPRFWMETSYDSVSVSDDKTVWKLNGQGVCTKTQEEFANQQQGDKAKKVKPNKLAKKWADTMTEKYDSLAKAEPIFRELRNLMDMSVVAAIVSRERLLQKASLNLPAIKGLDTVSTPNWNVPQTVPTQCSFARMTRSLIVTTSGGVTVDSWAVAADTKTDAALNKYTQLASTTKANRWWWNAK